MNVTAIIVTRGDVNVKPIVESLPSGWQALVYDNAHGWVLEYENQEPFRTAFRVRDSGLLDYAVYGRYAALDYARHELIYVQDDDVIVSDPEAIVAEVADGVVCNMPEIFRHNFYDEHALVGFGAAFPRELPGRCFAWFRDRAQLDEDAFNRTCDIIFTGLAQRTLVDIPIESLPYAHDDNRMWRQPDHVSERTRTLQIVKALASLDPVAT